MSSFSGDWFSKLSKKGSQQEPQRDPGVAPKPTPGQNSQLGAAHKKGDFISQEYEVLEILGKGGFGVVYRVYSHETGGVYALKTFLDKYLADQEVSRRFHKEASIWVDLGSHPYLVCANFVEEISGRLYIVMEYIAPNKEGLNSIEDFLQRQPPDLAQSLRWAIQICHGMEYAYSKGVRAHRDLKPANIMICQDMTAKVTDFGLAGVIRESPALRTTGLGVRPGSGQTMHGVGLGTPTHMPPEQFENAVGCDQRSDIYSFGIMLYQMASGGRLPFPVPMGADWQALYRLHRQSPVPRLESPLFPIIQRCLEKSPDKRYPTFKDLRKDLEPIFHRLTGEAIIPPQSKELEVGDLNNKGTSLERLGRHEEAIRCYDKALELDSRDASVWTNKGASLYSLGRYKESIHCYDQALEYDPRFIKAWNNKSNSLNKLFRYTEALLCYDKVLEFEPGYVFAWTNKGTTLNALGRKEEAILCFDKALELDPHFIGAWINKGNSLTLLGRYEETIHCFEKALELNPRFGPVWFSKAVAEDKSGNWVKAVQSYKQFLALNPHQYELQRSYARMRLLFGPVFHPRRKKASLGTQKADVLDPRAITLYNKGGSLLKPGGYEEAIRCYIQALELSPHYAAAWFNKAFAEDELGHSGEATHSYQQFLALNPKRYAVQKFYARRRLQTFSQVHTHPGSGLQNQPGTKNEPLQANQVEARKWNNKGYHLQGLGRNEKALGCYDKAMELDPGFETAWNNKGDCLNNLGRYEEGLRCLERALKLDPRDAFAWNNKGISLRKMGRQEESIRCYDQALECDPLYSLAWNNKGVSLKDLGRYEEAIRCYDKALELDPRLELARNNRKISLSSLGRNE